MTRTCCIDWTIVVITGAGDIFPTSILDGKYATLGRFLVKCIQITSAFVGIASESGGEVAVLIVFTFVV